MDEKLQFERVCVVQDDAAEDGLALAVIAVLHGGLCIDQLDPGSRRFIQTAEEALADRGIVDQPWQPEHALEKAVHPQGRSGCSA